MPGKKGRKLGRNKDDCKKYLTEGRQEKNKEIKMARHSKQHPNDTGSKTPVNYKRKKPLSYFENIFNKNLTNK